MNRDSSTILKMLLSSLLHHGATKSDMMMVMCLLRTPRQRFELTRWMVLENPSMDEILLKAMEMKDMWI